MNDYEYKNNITDKTSKDILSKILMQESLVDKEATLPLLEKYSNDLNISDIFFGTGISNPSELSVGLPFDFLLYPLVATKIRNGLQNGGHIHHLIADNHALLNKFDNKSVKRVASEHRRAIEDVIDKLGIDNYHIYLSSEVATDKNYKSLLERVSNSQFANNYAKFEAVDIEYFYRTRDTLLKLGWKFKGNSLFDEQAFDNEYIKGFGNNIMPVYLSSGKRFSDKSPNCVPYTLYRGELDTRFIISKEEDILKKVSAQKCSIYTFNMIQNHYKGIIRLFESTVEKIPFSLKTTWEKIHYINRLITD